MRPIAYFLGLMLILGCSKDTIFSLGEIDLKVKDPVEFDSGLNLEITKVDDSRCAVGVVCVWEGEALVTFDINYKGQSETIQLSKCNGETPRCKDSVVEKLNHRFRVIDVTPYPNIDVEVKEGDIVVRMNIEKL